VVGRSAGLLQVTDVAARIAAGGAKVLLTGESGVGKDVIARLIHARSPRAHGRFVALNCASFSEGLLESELFGHVKGAFTGAYRDKPGKLHLAHRGTIFLDEIAEMSLRMQAMLLRFLENGEIQPVGSDTPAGLVDVRVISATNRDLSAMVARGEFREDLLYRIRVAHVHVPPLRDRPEDVRPLVEHTIARSGRPLVVSEEAMRLLEQYRWPGNVRELQNVVEQMIALAEGPEAGIDLLPQAVAAQDRRALSPVRERRRRVSDDLYDGLTAGTYRFWDHVYPMFMDRDLTRADLRHLVSRGLSATGGNYRALLRLFRVADADYKRLLNFLASHDCTVNFREFRPAARADDAALRGAGRL
jgi:transcriptional regulator with PAS, ATPase and Fis domain